MTVPCSSFCKIRAEQQEGTAGVTSDSEANCGHNGSQGKADVWEGRGVSFPASVLSNDFKFEMQLLEKQL